VGRRQCCRVSVAPVPDDTTRRRGATLSAPATRAARNERVGALAGALQGTRGRTRRVDSTVVETNSHPPTDSGLRGEGGRGRSRLLRRATAVMGPPASLGPPAVRRRMRRVRRQRRQWPRRARRQGEAATSARRPASQRLLAVAQKTGAPAGHGGAVWQAEATPRAPPRVRPVEPCRPRGARGRDQPLGRLVHADVGPARATRGSLCEPHTQMMVRRKTGNPVECGRQGWLEAGEGGLISGSRSLAEAGPEFPSVPDRLAAHPPRCGTPPGLWAADRGVSSAAHEAVAHPARINRVVLP
jgi:transposase, IS5 family